MRLTRIAFLLLVLLPAATHAMDSTNYSVPSLQEDHGSGCRISTNYQISSDVISAHIMGESSSENFSLSGGLALQVSTSFSARVFINANAAITGLKSVTLDLVCGHPSGCAEVSVSNNGVSWSEPEPYSTSKSWDLIEIDGGRNVFVKYRNGLDEWSGVCSDSIVLDTTAPVTTISPTGGTYMSEQTITLTASEDAATIYYTTDGTVPTDASPVYSAPIELSADSTVKCFSEDSVGNPGPVASGDFTICDGTNLSISGVVRDAATGKVMPLVVITLDTGESVTTGAVDGAYSFSSLSRGYYTIESITTPVPGYVTYQSEFEVCRSSVSHDIVLTKSNTLFGGDTFSGYSMNSVNTATGNFFYDVTDLTLPGRGVSFAFDRAYNSQDGTDGPLGFGWTHNYNISLDESGDGDVTVRWGDGKAETWTPDGGGGYDPMPGVFDTLIQNPDSTFSVRRKDLIQYNFDQFNQLESIEDENGNTLTFSYGSAGVAAITDSTGRVIQFSYDTADRITRVLGPLGRSATFTYDVNGDLVTSTDLEGNTTSYSYDDYHQLLTITDPLGNVVITNTYDEQRMAVTSQRDAAGAETLYSYDVPTKTTQIIDPYGHITYHHFDDMLRLIEEDDVKGNSAYYVYDERGNLVSVTDKRGNETTYEHDDNGNVLVKTDPELNDSSATYDENNNPLTKTDANGNETLYTYDAHGNLETVTDPLGNLTSYTYDEHGQVLTVTDADLNVTENEYDMFGNVVAVTDALGNLSTFTYDIGGRKLTETHPLGRATAYEYDNMDRLVSVTDAMGGMATFSYDANGNKTEHIDANENRTRFSYDAKNRLIGKTTPLNFTESYTYDLLDRRTSVTNPNGATSSIVYDALGNVLQEIDALGNRVYHEYDANGNRIATVNANGYITLSEYDAMNRLVSNTDPLGNKVEYTHDPNGNVRTVTDALGNITESTYDAMNRLKTVKDPLNNMTENEYDELGRLASVLDARLNQTDFEYDALGRLTRVVDAELGEVTASYDPLGNRISMTDTRENTTTYTYDLLNRLKSMTDPEGNTNSMEYDAVGNLESSSDSRGTTFYEYDLDYRLDSVTYPDATTVTYTRDANGNPLSVSDVMGTISYEYSERDEVVSVTDPFGVTLGYTYDPEGNRTSIRYPGNKPVFYHHDAVNRLQSVQDWGGITTEYQYDDNGRLDKKTMGNGATVTYVYDDAGRLTAKIDKDRSGTVIASYSYLLDPNGNRTEMTVTQPLLARVHHVDDSFSYDDANRLLSRNGTSYEHDAEGNRTLMSEGSDVTQYEYNFDNMLTRVTAGANVDEYSYDSAGRRFSSFRNGVEKRYLLDLNAGMESVLAEMNGSNNIHLRYVHGDGLLYSVDATTGERLFYHYDPIGSTVAITDSDGVVTDKYAYLPYGKLTNKETEHENPFTYVGKYGVMLEPNGLYFMRARYYDPETRRFLSKDPVKGIMGRTQSLNPYQYVEGIPTLLIDPKGTTIGPPSVWWEPFVMSGNYGDIPGRVKDAYDWVIEGIEDMFCRTGGLTCESELSEEDDDDAHKDTEYEYDLYGNEVVSFTKSDIHLPSLEASKFESSVSQPEALASSSGQITAGPDPIMNPNPEARAPAEYLDVRGYAQRHYRREFAKLTDPGFVDRYTRSYIEYRIEMEMRVLEKKRYGYRTRQQEKRAKAQLNRAIAGSSKRLYASLTAALSKYSVLIRDLQDLPDFNSGNVNRSGVYANR